MEVPGSQGHSGRDFPLAVSQGPWHKEAGRQAGCIEQGESLEVGSGALRLSPPHIPQALSACGTQSPPGAAGSKPLGGQRQLPAGWTRARSEHHPGGTGSSTHSGRDSRERGQPRVHTLTFSSVRPFSTESAVFCRMRCRNAWRREVGRGERPRLQSPGGSPKKGLPVQTPTRPWEAPQSRDVGRK